MNTQPATKHPELTATQYQALKNVARIIRSILIEEKQRQNQQPTSFSPGSQKG